ncbi:MAG: c-type cytochrome [Nitrospira sp.]|nr:c-type cytochrome [Nitrospira sp.]
MSIHRIRRAFILSLSFMATAIVLHGNVSPANDGSHQDGDRHPLAGTVSDSSAGDAPRGKELYDASCVVCHGPRAEGNIGPRLAGNPLLSNEQVFRKIVHEGRHMMPPLKGSITDRQLADILAWLRTLP